MSIHFIDSNSHFEKALNHLHQANQIAVDLEFDKNYHRYGFNICLIQIYDGDQCYLIDPLSNEMDYRKLFPIFENPNIEIVTFAFGEDLRLLHSLGCFPKNIYDLDITTSLLNYPPSSLTNLIQDILEVDTGKSSQLSNWFKRPLTDQQKHYAAQDVLHLFQLKTILDSKAKEFGVSSWIDEENRVWDKLDYSDEANNGLYKEKDKKDLNEVEWYIFKELIHYRETIAEKYNKPSFQVIKKEILIEIAKDIRSLMGWENKRGIFRQIKNEQTKLEMIEVVKKAQLEAKNAGLSESNPASKSPTPDEMKIYREEQKYLKKMKSDLFDPIKKRIEEDYGEQTATYLLSNRIVSDLVLGNNGKLENYKKELYLKYAKDLGLDTATLLEIIE